jgi:hypothetical protein
MCFPLKPKSGLNRPPAFAAGVEEGIAVCVFYLASDPHRDSDIRFSNSDCSLPL